MAQPLHAPRPPSQSRPPQRSELLACLAFVDALLTAGFTRETLVAWAEKHLATHGLMQVPAQFCERDAGTIPAHGTCAAEVAALLLHTAFERVVAAMRGLLRSPPDEGFVLAAISAGRVAREQQDGQPQWVAHPRGGDSLSDIVLAFFAADLLENRETYWRALAVCDVCGRIFFEGRSQMRHLCAEHRADAARNSYPAVPAGGGSERGPR
jgi:hypothetical protein